MAQLAAKNFASDPATKPADSQEWGQYGVPAAVMISAIAATVTGTVYNFTTGAENPVKAGTILGNVSNAIAPFSTPELAAATEDTSVAIKLMVDLIGNIGAGICIGLG